MIRKVIRGNNIGRTVNYLFGPGKHNEHTNPHLIAAWDSAWLTDPTLVATLTTAKGRRRLIAELDAPRILHDVEVPGGHVYHVPLSLPAEDGLLGDDRWRQVVEEAVDRLGFGPDPHGRGGCRWIAVHHGLSINGNDHIHVVVQLVRGDGRIANLYRDWPKWDAVCQAAENRWNLTHTRRAGAGERPLSRAEIERTHHTRREPARRELAHRVRAAAAATATELDFLSGLRRSGVLIEPRVSGDQVVGYRVALPTDDGNEPLWLSGSHLARDLSLPKLRTRWEKIDPAWSRYVTELWRGERDLDLPERRRAGILWKHAAQQIATATNELRQHPPTDTEAWTQAVGHTADLMATLAHRLEPEPGPLYQAGQHLARAAQPDRTQHRPLTRSGPGRPILLEVARIVANSRDPAQTATIAAVILLAYGLVRLLDHLAARHVTDPAQRRQLQLAGTRLAQHPYAANYPAAQPRRRQPASPDTQETRFTPQSRAAPIDPSRQPHPHGARRNR